ncbi:MAG: exodeoxyribonuclease III, partial [Anaerolineae bacterium]|nr:exodeoxyribonuclease III [Anaerolineae bacterium]
MAGNVLKVATYNANSIRARMDAILSWLAKESPDVLCVQETKVQDADFPAAPLREAGYQVVFRGQKAHAGVAIISKDELEDVAFGIDDGEEPDEPRLIRGTIRGIHVINTYVPQGRSPDSEHFQYKLRWFERLRALFERHYAPEDMLLWAGDFNVAPLDIDVH